MQEIHSVIDCLEYDRLVKRIEVKFERLIDVDEIVEEL